MNFKNFLTNTNQLCEAHVMDQTARVVVGYGTFYPFHIGYIPMISEMLQLSVEHDAEPTLVIIRDARMSESALQTVKDVLAADYAGIRITVERTLQDSLQRQHDAGEAAVAILGDPVLTAQAAAKRKAMFGEATTVAAGYLPQGQIICEDAASRNDFESFRSHIIFDDAATALSTFTELRGTHGR